MMKKVVIAPKNSEKAVAFFDELARKKEETRKKVEAKTASLVDKIKRSVGQ